MRQLTRIACASALISLLIASQAYTVTIGVMGDSLSDEYSEESYGAYANNWTMQLVDYRGIDMGPTGSWGEPRRSGYEYNWARYGATTANLLSDGQHTGLAGQVATAGIDYVVLMIGANDQHAVNNMYANLYNGVWTPGDANTISWVNTVASNIETAVTTIEATGAKLLLANSGDFGVTPWVQGLAPIAAQRQSVTDVLTNQLGPAIDAIAEAHNLPLIDLSGLMNAIVGPPLDLHSTIEIGNVDIFLQVADNTSGTNLTAGFVADGIHPHTTIQGIYANLVMEGLNIGYGAGLTLFSEEEILLHRGVSYGGNDTLAGQIGDYRDYVINYVPEPSGFALAALGLASAAAGGLRRRRSPG